MMIKSYLHYFILINDGIIRPVLSQSKMQRNTSLFIWSDLFLFVSCLMISPLKTDAGIKLPINSHIKINSLISSAGIFHANHAAELTYNVRDFGAKGDGKTLDSHAINEAIEAAARAGGGTVSFPAGTYLSGSIRLKSNITLHLENGCILEAVADTAAYDKAEPNASDQYQDYGHSHWHNGFIWGENLHHVVIEGSGTIYGKGLTRNRKSDHLPQGLGDKAIALKNCYDIVLRGFSILHGGHFGILATGVNNLTIEDLLIDTNRDGMDIDCCKNVRITGCSVNSPWDDAICLKSSFALGYARATEDVTISDCMVSGAYQEGSLLDGTFKLFDSSAHLDKPMGRIKLGTESNGGFKNITITNCIFDRCRGLALETVDGGLLEDVTISNITMRHITGAPLFLRLGSRMRGPEGVPVGTLRRINITNIVVYDAPSETGCVISGIPGHEIEGVSIDHMRIVYHGGGTSEDARIQPPEKEKSYPEPDMFGKLPAYGFYIRHVKGIDLSNVDISYEKADYRPAFVLDDVQESAFRFIHAQKIAGVPVFALKSVEDFSVQSAHGLPDKTIKQASGLHL